MILAFSFAYSVFSSWKELKTIPAMVINAPEDPIQLESFDAKYIYKWEIMMKTELKSKTNEIAKSFFWVKFTRGLL